MDFLDEIRFLKDELSFSQKIRDTNYDQIVIAGMGGSGIAGKIFQELYTEKPLRLVEDYRIPKFISSNTLFIAISYSGTTEETIAAAAKAREQGARVVTISSGGTLSQYGHENIRIPRGDLQPRAAVGYLLMPLLLSFKITNKQEIKETYRLLNNLDRDNEECKKYAREPINGNRIPIIYGGAPYRAVAYRWKTQLNENAKVICYANYFPELNHNDTMALAKTYRKNLFYFFVLESDYQEIRKRAEITSAVTKTKFHVIKPKGESVTERVFYLIHFGDYLSYHLGKLRGLDPADMSLIGEVKRGLMEKGYELSQTKL